MTAKGLIPSRTPAQKLERLREIALAGDLPVKLWDDDQVVINWAYETITGSMAARKGIPTLDRLEREHVLNVMDLAPSKKAACDILGINESTLYRKLQAWQAAGLMPEET